MSSQGSLIRHLSRRKVPLARLTQEARDAGQLGADDELTIIIRRVTALEVTKLTGKPPALLRIARMRQPDESDEQWRKRWQELVDEDPSLLTEGLEYHQRLQEAVLVAGCVSPRVVANEADIQPGHEDDTLLIAELGPDAEAVYDAIVTFSGLPYTLRAGGGEMTTFPEQPSGDSDQPHGEVLRQDAERAAEPPAGGVEPGLGDLPG